MMRRWICLALALLCCVPAALAEADGYWTNNADWYYHLSEHCGGVEGMVPISPDGARAFGKYPCPVCVPAEDDGAEPWAVAMGKLAMIRFSDAWLNRQAEERLTSVFGFSGADVLRGAEADRRIAELLHGEAYGAFLADGAETRAMVPGYPVRYENVLCLRHIGSAWYMVVRTEEKLDGQYDVEDWEAYADRVWMEGDELYVDGDMQREPLTLHMNVQNLDGAEAAHEREGDVRITAYAAMDICIAELREAGADPDLLEEVALYIGGADTGLRLNGRMSGDTAVYRCALTNAELAALQSGAEVALRRSSPADGADFMDTPYAATTYGTSNRWGIVDREGNFVVEPTYTYIYRPDPSQDRVTTPRHFFCGREDGSSVILNGDTLEIMFESKRSTNYENPAMYREMKNIFAYSYSDPATFRSLEDGSVLYNFKGGEGKYVQGRYEVLADGLPQRLVATIGDGKDTRCALLDNHGNLIPNTEHQRVTALYWKGEHGVFLVESFDPKEYKGPGFGEKQTNYRYGDVYTGGAYGPHWRCGLMDENGDMLSKVVYTSVECRDSGEILLESENGERISINVLE